jgi:molecular chaperone DnaK
LIERNTTIPTRKSQVFSTAEDNQTAVDIRIFQGEREFAKDNKLLGQFRLEGIPAARRGVPQVEVSFDIDANGIVHVSAKDKASGKEQKVTITSSSGLSKEEIDRMVREAKEHEAEDKSARETVEKRNHLDGLILQVEKTVQENKEKLGADEVSKVEQAITKAKAALKEHENNAQELQKATDELMQSSHKIAEMLYSQQTGSQGAPQDQDEQKNDDKNDQGPIDTEIS